MKYLFIDTCSSNLIISTIIDNKIDYFFNDKNNNDTSSKVMKVIKEAVPDINTVDKIFVVNGPGSFTGIRVGVTIAKMIGFCLNIPIIKLSELELLATTKTNTKYNASLIDARRGYVYAGIYDQDLNCYLEDQHILLSDIKYPDSYTVIDNYDNIDLLKIIKKHEFDEPVNPHDLKPNYLKRTEAEEKLDDKRS